MIEPNFNLMLWILFITYSLRGISSIVLGVMGKERDKFYNGGDVVAGVIALIIMVIIAFS